MPKVAICFLAFLLASLVLSAEDRYCTTKVNVELKNNATKGASTLVKLKKDEPVIRRDYRAPKADGDYWFYVQQDKKPYKTGWVKKGSLKTSCNTGRNATITPKKAVKV